MCLRRRTAAKRGPSAGRDGPEAEGAVIRETLDAKKMTQTKIVALAAEPIQTLAVGACVSPLIGSRGGGECAICQAKVQAAAMEELQPEEQPQQPQQQPAARAVEQERQPEEGEWGWDDDEAELQFGTDDAGSPAASPPAGAGAAGKQGQSQQRSEGRGERRDAASARGVEPGSRSAGRRAGGGGAAAAGPSIQAMSAQWRQGISLARQDSGRKRIGRMGSAGRSGARGRHPSPTRSRHSDLSSNSG